MSDKAQQRYNNRLRASIILMIEEANASVLPERRISIGSAMAVASRSLDATKNSRSGDKARTFAALRAVSQFVALATKNRESSAALAHSDLLPIGHPASTARHAMTAGALLHARAQWIAADPYIDSSVRSLVATAYSQPRNTIERSHAFARIAAVDFGLVPQSVAIDAQTAITAAFGFGLGGNSSVARRARAMMQRRDSKGRFAFMGGMFRFKVKLRSGEIIPVSGRVVGAYDGDAMYQKSYSDGIQIELSKSPDGTGYGGIYVFPSSKGESAPAMISEEYLKDLPGVEIPESLPDGPDVVSTSDPLFRNIGIPLEWNIDSNMTSRFGEGKFNVFGSVDGYFAKVPKSLPYDPDKKDTWTLHRANLDDNSVGEEIARGSSWADLVSAAEKDQDAYEKVLLAQDEGSGRNEVLQPPDGWTVSEKNPPVFNETGQVISAVYESPSGDHIIRQNKSFVQTAGDYEYKVERRVGQTNYVVGKANTWADAADLAKKDGPQNEEAKKRLSGELPPYPAGTGKDWVKHEGAWIDREIGASYDFSNDQLTKFAEKAFNLAYPQQPKSDFLNQKMGWYKDEKGKWYEWDEGPGQTFSQYMAGRRQAIKDYFKRLLKLRDAQDTGAFDPAKDGQTDDSANFYKKVSAGVKSQRTEPLYVEGAEPAAVPEAPAAELPASVDLNPDASDSLTSQIQSAIGNKQAVRFKYSGTDREITPTKVWTNPKNGNVNVTADDGKNYTVSKIEAPTPAAVPEQEEVSVPEVPGEGETQANVVDLTDVPKAELRSSIDKAIAEEKPVVFMYNDKLREVTPVRIWDNPKNGKVNLTAVDSEGNEKNYTLDKFAEPVDSKITQTELDDIINMPQEELDDFVDAVWPAPTPDLARVIEPPVRGLQSIDTKGSTAVQELAYDNILKKLYVQFKSKDGKFGGIYEYIDVEQDFVDRITQTDSIGKLIPELKKDYKAIKINQFPIETPGAFIGFKKEAPSKALTEDIPEASAPEFDEELFDSIFETPDGAYKPNIYETYEPTGRTVQDSADYTDDPNLLSTKFDMGQLVRALAEAVLPSDNNPATGKGNLPFESGDEPVAAEAIIEAIDAAGLNGDVILAGIYDRALDPDREETNVARLIDAQDSIPTKQTSTFDDRREAIDKAVDLNAQLGTPQRAARAVSEMANFQEKNPKITQLADDLKEMQDSGAAFDEIAFSDALDKYLPLSTSADPQDREAFSALWGMFMSLDGGSSTEEEFVTPGSFRNLVVQGISRQTQADEATAMDAYDELINNYGGVPEFVAGKQAIADGKASLEDESTAGAFFRLVKAAARPNSTTLWRSIGVRQDDPLKDQYTTPGSAFSIDPRSFTAEPLQMSNGGITPSYAVTDPDVDRVVFKIDAFDGSSISAEGISWFPEELEHFAYGTYEVRDVTRTKSLIPGRQDDYVVTIEQVEAPDLSVIDPWNGQKRPGMWWNDMPKSGLFDKLTDYGDISEWNRIGGQTGSNAGGFYEDGQGNRYYAKVARSQSHADNEMLASAFYKEFGIKASEVGYGTRNGDLQVITPLIPGASSDIDDNIRDGDEKVINQLRDAFAVDAWLANYDVLGAVNDNVVTDRNGDAVRLDPGGALMWRARGGPKEWWGDSVDEIDTMRDPDWNQTAAAVFGGMTDEEVKNSARYVAAITPSRIDEMVDAVITDPADAEMLKERLKQRRENLLDRLGIEAPKDVLDEPVSLKNAMGYAAKDLAENDVSIGDSFTIERVFTDEDTPKGKVSVQGYFPGHESQRKEWNENTVIDVVRGGTIPPKGDKPALHRPKAPYEPSPPAFTGSISSDLADATTWSQVQDVLNGKDLIFFDYETTGFPDKETGEVNTNKPVQLGAVRVRNGEVVDRFNVFMNPGENLGTWSRNNLKDSDGNPLTDEWLGSQVSLEDAHKDFVTWLGDSAILGGHNVPFDRGVLEKALAGANIDYTPGGYVDTLRLARDLVAKKTKKNPEGTASHKLGDLTEYYGIPLEGWHTADADAEAASALLGALVTDAAGRPDADVSALNLNEQNTKYQEALSQFQALKDEYADSLAQYETDKAIAAAWDCNGGGGGMTSAGEESSNCNVPSLDDLIKNATPQPQDFIDPDGVDSGSVSSPVSYVDNGDEVPESDGIDTRPATETTGTTGTNWPPVDDPDDAFTPTAQQQAVFEAVFADNNVVIRAAAGAGKTSTLVTLAKRIGKYFPNKKIVYIAFNTSVANEGRKKMPGNVEVRTADSIAHGYVKDNMPELFKKFKSTTSLYSPNEIAEWLSVPAIQYTADDGTRKTMEPRGVVRILRGALYNFSISDDETLMTKHFDVPTEDVTPALLNAAERWWNDILDPNGQMPFGFGQMKKIWSLSNPDFSSTSSGLKNAVDFVFLDEAQDTNDVLGSVVRDQPDTVKKVIVGDENQAIYSFMGATNWLDKADTDVDLPLTQSWRFNQVIANVANKFLVFKEQYLDQPMKFVVEGGGPGGEVVPRRSMENADIVLVRSNAGAFDEVLTELDRGKTVGVTASFRNDMVDFASAVEWLQADPATRGKRPAKMPEELREFKSWKEVLNEAEKEDSDLSRKNNILVGMVEEEGVAGLNSIISQLKTVKGAGDTKDVKTGVDRAELPDTYEDGDSGSLVGDLKFEVDGNDVVLRGNTYGVKEEIKKIGKSVVAYNPDRKVWVVAGKTDEEKRKNLTKIQDQIAGPDTGGKSDAVDVIISTVHQAKGLEYPNVRIGGDFRGPRQDKQGNWIYPSIEEINIAYVAVTRPESQIDMGSLDWINDYVSDARVDEAMQKLSIAGKESAPALDATDEPASPPPTVLPDVVDEVADTPESVVEDPIGEAPMPEPSAETGPPPAPTEEGAVGQDKTADLNLAFESALDWVDQITDPEAEGDMKMKPSATSKARQIADEISSIRSQLESGAITEDQALAQLNALLDSLPDYDGASNDQINLWTLVQEIQEVRNILDGTYYQRPTGKGLPPIDAVDSKGRPVGYSRDGIFLTPGKRVRDKWGYAGTVEAYNEGDWINVYVRYDIDPRDPEKVKKGNWGPGVARVSKNPTTLTVLDPNDDTPWIDNGKIPENKKPKRLDEQVAALKTGQSGKGEKGGGLPKVKAPEGANEAPEVAEESSSTPLSSTYLNNVPGPSERPINSRVEDMEVRDPNDVVTGTWVLYTTKQSAEDMITNGVGTPVVGDLNRGVRKGLPEGSLFVGMHDWPMMQYISSQWDADYPGEERVAVTVRIPDDLKMISIPNAPTYTDLINSGVPSDIANRQDEYIALAKAENLTYPEYVAAARMAYDAGYEAVVFDYEGMLILPSAQDREDARKAILLEEDTKDVPNIVESPSPAQAPVSEWNRTLEPEDLAATEQKFKKDYEDNGVKPKYVGYDDPVRYYQSNGYRAMNAILRGDVSWLDTEGDGYEDPTDNVEEASAMILELDAVMRSMPATSEDLVSYRGISSKNQEMMDLISSLEVGGVFEDPGFVSTTLDRDRAEFFAEFDGQLVEILTPAGAVGVMTNAYLQDDNAWYQEREWILDRGTSFQVVSKKDGVITVVATKQTNDGDKPSLSDIKKNLRNVEEQENLVKWRGATTSTVKSPITGESVTVVRGLSGDDVWSLRNDELTPPASMLPVFIPMYPEGDKEHEGDGWYFARSGKRYWGQFGAAGALLVRKGTNGKNEYLLGKRAAWMSSGGGKWAYPGGAHSNAENAFFTLRTVTSEVKEELGIDLDDYQFSGLDEFDSQVEPDWKYTTLFIPEPPSGFPEPKISDIETELTGWFTADDIKQMDATGSLHESMSAVLDELLAKGEETVFSTEQVHLDPDSDTPKAFVARYGMSSGEIQRMAEDLSRHFGDMRARLATKLETQNSIEDTLKSIPDAKKDSLSALRITFEGLLKEIWSGPKLTSSERDEKFYGILLNALDGSLDKDDDARDEVTLGSTVVDGVRIEPTGAPVREIENPLPLSESGIAGVASLGSAVALVRSGAENIDRPPGGLAAVTAAVDGVDIEDLEVRVFPVVTPDGENRIRLKFKLTAWSGTMLAQKIEKSIDGAGQKLGWTKTDAGRVQLQASTLDSATGKLILSNDKVNPGYGAYQGASANDVFPWEDDGVMYLIDPDDAETPDSSPRIEFIRSSADAKRLTIQTGQYIGAPAAFHNLVTIDLPYDATESDIADALRLAGVRDVRSADRTDANTLIENKLISQFSGDNNPAFNVLKPELRADILEGIENKWGAKADDVDIVSSPSGRIEYLLPESVAEKLVKTTGVTYMLHTIHNGLRDELYAEQQRRHEEGRNNNIPYEETMMTLAQKSEVAAKFIARLLAKGSLQSTVTRSTEGIPVRGWSTLEDIATGGADYVFLSPRDIKGAISLANDGLNPTDIEFIWESKPLFRNMSTYANAYDAYGERSDGTKIQEVRSGYSEFIVKNEVSFDTLDTLSVAVGVKGPLIEELNQMGITEIGGKPLDEVIEIVGERSKSRVAEEKGMSAEEVAKVAQTLSDAGIEGIDYDDYTWSLKAAFPEKFPDGFIPAPAGSKVIMAPDTYLTVGGAYKDAVGLTVLEPNGQIYVYHKNGEDSTKPELVWQAGQGGAEKLADHLAESAKSGNLVKKYLPKPGEFGSMQTSTGITEHSAKIVYVVGLKDASADVQVGAYPNVPGGHTGADQPVVSATVEPPSLETIMAAYRMWIGSGDPASSVLSMLSAYLNVRIPLELRVILTEIINAVNTGDTRWEERNPEFLSKVTKKMTELSVRNSSQAGVRAMTADGEEIAVLPVSSVKELLETKSYVNDYVLLEVMSGKGKGSTRRVAHIQTIDQGDHTGNIALYIPTEENALILPLDRNKNVVFGPGNRFGTFTSRGIKYRIKPIPAVKNQTKPAQSSEPTDGR